MAVLDALAESAPQFMDVLVLTLFLMIIFGIMGIQVTLSSCAINSRAAVPAAQVLAEAALHDD